MLRLHPWRRQGMAAERLSARLHDSAGTLYSHPFSLSLEE
jgi:hypothetical protein